MGYRNLAHLDRPRRAALPVRLPAGEVHRHVYLALLLCLFVLVLPELHGPAYPAERSTPERGADLGKSHSRTRAPGAPAAHNRPTVSDPFGGTATGTRFDNEVKPEDVTRLFERLDEPGGRANAKPAESPGMDKRLQRDIERMLKRTISHRPADVHVLDPVFAAATTGTLNQRKAATEILGSLKEPLAEPLLARIAQQADNPLKSIATIALGRIRSKAVVSRESLRMRYFQVFLMAVSILIAGGLIAAAVWELRKNGNRWRVVLMLLCVLLTGWLFGIIGTDYLMSTVTNKGIDDAIKQKNLVALAKKIDFDWSDYPGDSYAARHLVSKGDPGIIPLLTRIENETLPSIRYQDYWNRHLRQRIDWTIARLEAERRGDGGSGGLPAHEPPR